LELPDPFPPIHDLLTTLNPMLADTSDIKLETLAGTHLFDTKVDGVRALAAWDGSRLTMRNRNGRQMDNYLDLEVAAAWLPSPLILDGEIVADSGKFQDIAWRDKQRGAKVIKAMQDCPAHFAAFDILWHPDKGDVRHLPYINRRQLPGRLPAGAAQRPLEGDRGQHRPQVLRRHPGPWWRRCRGQALHGSLRTRPAQHLAEVQGGLHPELHRHRV